MNSSLSNPNLRKLPPPLRMVPLTSPHPPAYLPPRPSKLSHEKLSTFHPTTNPVHLQQSSRTSLLTSRGAHTNLKTDPSIPRIHLPSSRLEDSRKSNPISSASTMNRLQSSQISSTLPSYRSIKHVSAVQDNSYLFTENSHVQQKNPQANFNVCLENRTVNKKSIPCRTQMGVPKTQVLQKVNEVAHETTLILRQNKSVEKPKMIQPIAPIKPVEVETVVPKAVVDIKPRSERQSIMERNNKIVKPISFLPPALLLRSVTAHKVVQSDKEIPVIGMYFSTEKDRKFVLREFSKMNKNKVISFKVLAISAEQLIPTEVIRIPANKDDVDYSDEPNQDDNSMTYSRGMASSKNLQNSQSKKGSRLSDNIFISIYKSPDVVIFSPQLIQGQKLQKSHVKRIAVQGKPVIIENLETEIDPNSNDKVLTPLQKYLQLKKALSPVSYVPLDINEEKQPEEQILDICEEAEFQIIEDERAIETLVEAYKMEAAEMGFEKITFVQKVIIQQEVEVQEYEMMNYQEFQTSLNHNHHQPLPRATFQPERQTPLVINQDIRHKQYVSHDLPYDLLHDLRQLKMKQGLPTTNAIWYKLIP